MTPTQRTRAELKRRGYDSWSGMIQRCTNPSNPSWPRYGGRGIRVCEAWRVSFAAFHADMGNRPDGATIERIDNDGPYSSENCRWASRREQGFNRSTTKLELHEPAQIIWLYGLGYTQREIGSHFGVNHRTISLIVRGEIWRSP